MDAGRDAVCTERRLLKLGAPPPPAFCSLGGTPSPEPPAPFGRVPAHALRRARPRNEGRCARRPAANFLQVQLGHSPGRRGRGAPGEEGARSEREGGRERGGGCPLGRGPEREPIGQPRLLPITRLPPIPPLPFPKSRSHCAAPRWCPLGQSLENRVGTGMSGVRRPGQRS